MHVDMGRRKRAASISCPLCCNGLAKPFNLMLLSENRKLGCHTGRRASQDSLSPHFRVMFLTSYKNKKTEGTQKWCSVGRYSHVGSRVSNCTSLR